MSGKSKLNFVIFGGTGDLTFRKLIPALYDLYRLNQFDPTHKILIIGRREYTHDDYRNQTQEWVEKFSRVFDKEIFNRFKNRIHYFKMDFTELQEYKKLNVYFNENPMEENIYYYAVAPEYFSVITDGIHTLDACCNGKILLEKPFGSSLDEATRLSEQLESSFGKENIYRIDHYLGKEMIRSIQTIRFANPIFANSWNCENIASVQIHAYEEIGVGTRGAYYDQAGALKDMVQNHLMQLLSLVAMEEATSDIHIQDRQIEVLRALRKIDEIEIEKTLVLGQYKGYKMEDKVSPVSTTETFAACNVFVDNERWQGVPFYIKTGKRMKSREMNVIITFKTTALDIEPNVLVINIQPLEGVSFQFNIKKPGDSETIVQADMDFCQNCVASNRLDTPEAYERLIAACIQGDRTWFSSWEQIALSWSYVEQLHQLYIDNKIPVYAYEQNTNGPEEINKLLSANASAWEQSQLTCILRRKSD